MEEEARNILRTVLDQKAAPAKNLGTAIHKLFKLFGSVALDIPPRKLIREPRLRSLWNFIDGEYTLPNDLDKVENIDIAGKKYYALPKGLRNRITGFRVVVAFVRDAREPEISLLFSRMQMGVRLTRQSLEMLFKPVYATLLMRWLAHILSF